MSRVQTASPGQAAKDTDRDPRAGAPAPGGPPATAAAAHLPDSFGHVPANGQLPPELIAVPLWASQSNAPLKLCVVCRKAPDPAQGHLVLRRDLLDAKVFLGCVVDAFGVIEMTEVWVQSLDGMAEAAKANILTGDAVNNATLDERWRKMFEVSINAWPVSLIACGFERANPPPTFIDVAAKAPVHPEGWALCTDDEVLRAAGLPIYSTTLHRYLVRGKGADQKFVPLSPDAPAKANTVAFESILPNARSLLPLNAGGGLMLIKPAGNVRLGEINDLFGGKPYDGAAYGKSRLRLSPLQSLSGRNRGLMFPGDPQTTAAAFAEAYLLKVALFASMIEDVGRFTVATQRPLLNLQPASFGVRMDEVSAHLPALWTARASLVDAGDAVPVQFPQGDTKFNFCLPGKSVKASIYQPALVARGSVQGFGQLYLSGTGEHPESKTFDGTLTLADPIRPTRRDVFRVRVPVANGRRVDLYVRVDPGASPTAAVLKFRSVPDPRLRAVQNGVEALIGVPLQEVPFEFYPLFSSACDVYSLAVLGAELLLTRPGANHAEQFSELRNLATRCRESYSDRPLEARIEAIFGERPEWARKLGPQSMIAAPIDPALALRFITPELWWSTLAMLVRMLPGQGPDSSLADFGDTAHDRMDGIYQDLAKETRELAGRARTLLFGEWGINRQIGSILEEMKSPRQQPAFAPPAPIAPPPQRPPLPQPPTSGLRPPPPPPAGGGGQQPGDGRPAPARFL